MSSITTRKTTASVAVTDADVILIDDQGHRGDITPDGALKVAGEFTAVAEPGLVRSIFGQALAVIAGVETDVLTFIVAADTELALLRIEAGGDNIARYSVEVDGTLIARQRTWFNGSGLTANFDFSGQDKRGLILTAGQEIKVKAIHSRPDVGDFEARISAIQKDL
jgi:hypothetical protein